MKISLASGVLGEKLKVDSVYNCLCNDQGDIIWQYCPGLYTGCHIVTEQKYWLITQARNNFRGQTVCHFFTVARTFWYLVFSNQSSFLINFNNSKLLKA